MPLPAQRRRLPPSPEAAELSEGLATVAIGDTPDEAAEFTMLAHQTSDGDLVLSADELRKALETTPGTLVIVRLSAAALAVLNEQDPNAPFSFCQGRVTVYPGKDEIHVDGAKVDMYTKSRRLVERLGRTPDVIVSDAELLKIIWGENCPAGLQTEVVKSYISRAKRAMGPVGQLAIMNVRYKGYFAAP